MTVNGNVTLAGTLVSVFEITPTVSDKLIVNSNLLIAKGAALQINVGGLVHPSVVRSDRYGRHHWQLHEYRPVRIDTRRPRPDGATISLLGQFVNEPSFTPQVQGSIDYVNGLMTSGKASAVFVAAVPALGANSSASNPAVFTQLTPEAYASAGQIAVGHGLELADAGRSDAFAPRPERSTSQAGWAIRARLNAARKARLARGSTH